MSELYVYIFLFVLVVGFWAWELWVLRRDSKREKQLYNFMIDSDEISSFDFNECPTDKNLNEPDSFPMNLADLFKLHSDEDFYTFSLEATLLTDDRAVAIRKLRPCDRLYLLNDGSHLKVYNEGRLVGQVSSANSKDIISLMNDVILKGVYVLKNNTDNEKGCVDVDVMVFYEYRELSRNTGSVGSCKFKVEGLLPFIISQN